MIEEGLLGIANIAFAWKENEDVPFALGAQFVNGMADRALNINVFAQAVSEGRQIIIGIFEDELGGVRLGGENEGRIVCGGCMMCAGRVFLGGFCRGLPGLRARGRRRRAERAGSEPRG